MTDYLLDTNVLILHFRNRHDVTQLLKRWRQDGQLFISTVVRAELLAGMHPREEQRTMRLLDSTVSIPVDAAIADRAGRLIYQSARKGVGLTLPDTLIASTALIHGLTLVTTNIKHFPIPELEIYQLV